MGKGRAEEDETKHVHCQKLNKRNFCPTSASRHRCSIADKEYGGFPKSSIEQILQMRHQEIRICYVEYDDQAEARAASSSRLVNSH